MSTTQTHEPEQFDFVSRATESCCASCCRPHALVFNTSISSPSEAASVRSVGEEAGSSPAALESSPEDPVEGCGANPGGQATSLGDGEPEINSTLTDSPQKLSVSSRTEEKPSADTPAQDQPDCLTDPQPQNHNSNNIRCADDDATRPSIAPTDGDENKESSAARTDDVVRNESPGNGVPTRDGVDGVTPQATPTPSVGSAHPKPEKKKHFLNRNKKSSNEGNLLIYPIKVVFFRTGTCPIVFLKTFTIIEILFL